MNIKKYCNLLVGCEATKLLKLIYYYKIEKWSSVRALVWVSFKHSYKENEEGTKKIEMTKIIVNNLNLDKIKISSFVLYGNNFFFLSLRKKSLKLVESDIKIYISNQTICRAVIFNFGDFVDYRDLMTIGAYKSKLKSVEKRWHFPNKKKLFDSFHRQKKPFFSSISSSYWLIDWEWMRKEQSRWTYVDGKKKVNEEEWNRNDTK